MKTKTKASGFFIVEILIVLLIVGILAIALLPNLALYVDRAKFQDVIAVSQSAKSAVELCVTEHKGSTNYGADCGSNALSKFPATTVNTTNVASGSAAIGGNATTVTITATGRGGALDGITSILTGTPNADGAVEWTQTGTCTEAANSLC